MRKIENNGTSLRHAFLMHARDHLAVEALQQHFKFLAQYPEIIAVLIIGKACTQYLIALLFCELIEKLLEALNLISFAQHQVHRQINA